MCSVEPTGQIQPPAILRNCVIYPDSDIGPAPIYYYSESKSIASSARSIGYNFNHYSHLSAKKVASASLLKSSVTPVAAVPVTVASGTCASTNALKPPIPCALYASSVYSSHNFRLFRQCNITVLTTTSIKIVSTLLHYAV